MTVLRDFFYRKWGGRRRPFVVFDVGCGGGFDRRWQSFGEAFRGVGFDAIENEIERLESTRPPAIKYEAAFIGLGSSKAAKQKPSVHGIDPRPNFFARSSAHLAGVGGATFLKEAYRIQEAIRYATRHLSLDDYADSQGIDFVTVLKTDTDGHEIDVLKGAERLLSDPACLCVLAECNFHSIDSCPENCFANIDLFLTNKGFHLFKLSPPNCYSRAALPGLFLYDIPAQTLNGQAIWAEALYMRDLVLASDSGSSPPVEHVIQAICLFEMFDLSDCAAELLLTYSDLLAAEVPDGVEALLDKITPNHFGKKIGYRKYVEKFKSDPTAFYRSRHSNTDISTRVLRADSKAVPVKCEILPTWDARADYDGSICMLVTAAAQWAYAAILKLPRESDRRVVEIDLRVTIGSVGISLQRASANELSGEILVSASQGFVTVQLFADNLADFSNVMFRNASKKGRSKAEIRSARLRELVKL